VLLIEYGVHSPSLTSRFLATKVPTKPPPNVEEVRNQFDQTLVRQLEEVGASSSQLYACLVNVSPLRKHFQTRPVWTRASLLNQFTAAQAREIHK
jgi:general transcription factor 3C polypeptide 5 (transcription factor C subunit 1)